MATKLFVGNLDYTVTSEDLRAKFGEVGEVKDATVLTDRETGRSRGFGFVEYANDADAKKAIETLNGKDLKGRNMTVNEARPQAPRS